MNVKTQTIARLRDALLESGRRPSTVLSSAYEALTRAGLLSLEETTALNRVDPLAETMFLMMAPLLCLYEVGIYLCQWTAAKSPFESPATT